MKQGSLILEKTIKADAEQESADPILDLAAETPAITIPEGIQPLDRLTPEQRGLFEQFAYQYGQSSDSYLGIEPDRHCLFLPSGRGAVSVVPSSRYIHVPGSLLAPEDAKDELIQFLAEYGREHKKTIACYSINIPDSERFIQAGWETTKFGEEPVFELDDLTWSGKQYEWIRRQQNYCRRQGVAYEEIHRDQISETEWNQLAREIMDILQDDLRDRPYPRELYMLEGRLLLDHLGRRRLFIARKSKNEPLEAFLICNPMLNGTGWAFESYRKSKQSTRGVVAFLMKSVADQMREEGVRWISLCMVPGKGVGEYTAPGMSRLVRFSMNFWYNYANWMFNSRGQCHFKSRFRPEFQCRFVCVTPGSTIRSIYNFLKTTGGFDFSLKNVVRDRFRKLFRRFSN